MQVLHEKKRRKMWAWKRQQPPRIESSCTGTPEWGDWGGYIFTTNRCDIEENWMNATNFHFTHAFQRERYCSLWNCGLFHNDSVVHIWSTGFSWYSMSQMVCHKSTNTISSERKTTRNKPAPSLATSSSSVDVLAEAMASGSFRMKGNTSLEGKTLIEVKEQRGGTGGSWTSLIN